MGEHNLSESTRQIVVFGLGEEEYALTIGDVPGDNPLRRAADGLLGRSVGLGVISLRGKIIPICDLSTRLGVPRGEGESTKIIVVQAGGHTIGLVVDDVIEVLTVDEGDIEELHLVSGGAHSVTKVDQRLIVLLSSESIFDSSELADAV